jgi:hypothetical protein
MVFSSLSIQAFQSGSSENKTDIAAATFHSPPSRFGDHDVTLRART